MKFTFLSMRTAKLTESLYSLPMQKPWTGITNDEAARACFSKGEGWHLMTRAEWGLLAEPQLEKWYFCHMATRTMESTMQTRKNMESQQENPKDQNRIRTGNMDPRSYIEGVHDLSGNAWEMVRGLENKKDGQLEMVKNNDAALILILPLKEITGNR